MNQNNINSNNINFGNQNNNVNNTFNKSETIQGNDFIDFIYKDPIVSVKVGPASSPNNVKQNQNNNVNSNFNQNNQFFVQNSGQNPQQYVQNTSQNTQSYVQNTGQNPQSNVPNFGQNTQSYVQNPQPYVKNTQTYVQNNVQSTNNNNDNNNGYVFQNIYGKRFSKPEIEPTKVSNVSCYVHDHAVSFSNTNLNCTNCKSLIGVSQQYYPCKKCIDTLCARCYCQIYGNNMPQTSINYCKNFLLKNFS